MKKMLLLASALLMGGLSVQAQTQDANAENVFTVVKELPITSIKDQANSGTCWSYSMLSYLESEVLRNNPKADIDFSEMQVVSHSYKDKGDKYIRLHGKLNFGQGGSFYDVLYVMKHYGLVPQKEMEGLNYGTSKNAHNEIASIAEAFLQAIVKNPNGRISPAARQSYNTIIDSYLGVEPQSFQYDGKTYSPKSFVAALGLNADDYVSLTSYTHHPFYSQFAIEIEDNWRGSNSYNLPIAELMQVMDNAIENGYTIAWGTDVSEVGFTRDGIGVLADVEAMETKGSDQDRWVGLSRSAKQAEIMKMIGRADCPEAEPTQEYRQDGYDNYSLTDDHGMQIYGIAKNQLGKKFYMVKNSWGEAGKYNGIWYVSENFVAGKTMNIIVNKKALPKAIAKKLGI